jgi:hypothetical protein
MAQIWHNSTEMPFRKKLFGLKRLIIREVEMKTFLLAILLLFTFSFVVAEPASAQPGSESNVIVQGNPPLTESMVAKSIILLEWALDIKFSDEQKIEIIQDIVNDWKTNDKEAMNITIEIANLVDGLRQASAEDRNKAKDIIRADLLKGLRSATDNKISQMVLQVYEATHSGDPKTIPQSNSASATTTKSKQRVGADGFSGIYIGIYNPPPGAAINSVQIAFVTFLPDGHVYWMLPPEGLLYFDPRVAQRAHPDDWGTYKIVGNEIQITLGNNLRRVFVKEGNKLKLQRYEGQYRAAQEYTFSPLATGDGLKLDGTYRRWAEAPGITFSKDGRFRDEGFTRNFGTIGRPDGTTYQDDGIGGTGTYLIEQNTLELNYSDGRVKRFAFTALPSILAQKPVQSFRINYEIFKLD